MEEKNPLEIEETRKIKAFSMRQVTGTCYSIVSDHNLNYQKTMDSRRAAGRQPVQERTGRSKELPSFLSNILLKLSSKHYFLVPLAQEIIQKGRKYYFEFD